MSVLGVGISAVDRAGALARIAEWIASGVPNYVCVTGVHGVMESQRDPELRRIHNASGMTTPDGMPLVWAGRRAGAYWMQRVYGPDLMLDACREGIEHGWSHYFCGGGDGVAQELAHRLAEMYPGLRVVGTHTPPFRPLTPAESDALVADIDRSEADIVWVGLSTPKQERFMDAHVERVKRAQLIGVGAAFDIHAGLLRQAPPWMRRNGLEWAFRLGVEPRRLFGRYARNNPAFIVRIARNRPRLMTGSAREPA